MLLVFDPVKDLANQIKHGVSLALAEAFEMEGALIRDDLRFAYGEGRVIATGPIGNRVFVKVYTMRVISLRKANRREVLKYVYETQGSYPD
ncbi:BrnT family toxin [Cupriavidus taiwanensis]|uniref:BrnT family toxin n=1 Tax=Cupriavidus taiwanensis TaxID=164546 RepID=UPI002540EE09|nr:BrnT family toxin [Cupriavidus taiwanensis]MDK3025820.1 BrnT family toxin [Cupriavidus taiwanensis]